MKYFIHRESREVVELSTVSFASQGGGWVKTLHASEFFKEFEPYELSDKPVPGFVCFDDGPSYPALIQERRWNGWAMPYFDFETATKVMNDVNADSRADEFHITYDPARDGFVLDDALNSPDEPEVFSVVEFDGVKYYPIGAGSWCWNVSSHPETT